MRAVLSSRHRRRSRPDAGRVGEARLRTIVTARSRHRGRRQACARPPLKRRWRRSGGTAVSMVPAASGHHGPKTPRLYMADVNGYREHRRASFSAQRDDTRFAGHPPPGGRAMGWRLPTPQGCGIDTLKQRSGPATLLSLVPPARSEQPSTCRTPIIFPTSANGRSLWKGA